MIVPASEFQNVTGQPIDGYNGWIITRDQYTPQYVKDILKPDNAVVGINDLVPSSTPVSQSTDENSECLQKMINNVKLMITAAIEDLDNVNDYVQTVLYKNNGDNTLLFLKKELTELTVEINKVTKTVVVQLAALNESSKVLLIDVKLLTDELDEFKKNSIEQKKIELEEATKANEELANDLAKAKNLNKQKIIELEKANKSNVNLIAMNECMEELKMLERKKNDVTVELTLLATKTADLKKLENEKCKSIEQHEELRLCLSNCNYTKAGECRHLLLSSVLLLYLFVLIFFGMSE